MCLPANTFKMVPLLSFVLNISSLASDLGSVLNPNNACNNFRDYYHPLANKNCFYNPDMKIEPAEIIKKHTGNVETHLVTTEDGYILTLFKIPHAQKKGTIFLVHPLTTYSKIYVALGEDSMAFILWQAGYEVWLNNFRGTSLSQKHENLSASDQNYWDFSFHEMGIYDFSANLAVIKKTVGEDEKIIVIGHSMATTAGLIYASLKPEEAEMNVKIFIFLSAAAYFEAARSPIMFLRPLEPLLTTLFNILRIKSVLPFIYVFREFISDLARFFPLLLRLIVLGLAFITGWTPEEMDSALINFDCAHYVDDHSVKTLVHYLQLFTVQTRFQMYDNGPSKNLALYGNTTPPEYPLYNISVPLFLISSHQDSMCPLEGSDFLLSKLRQDIRQSSSHLKVSGLNHFDVQLGRNRIDIYVNKLLEFLDRLH